MSLSEILKPPWYRGKERHPLSRRVWTSMFTEDRKLGGGGLELLKKVRLSGVDPSIRAEVWPFLLGVYNLSSSEEEREIIRSNNREVYEKLRRQCLQLLKPALQSPIYDEDPESPLNFIDKDSISIWDRNPLSHVEVGFLHDPAFISKNCNGEEGDDEEVENSCKNSGTCSLDEDDPEELELDDGIHLVPSPRQGDNIREDFVTWQRIIRKDAVRGNVEWVNYSEKHAATTVISEEQAHGLAARVGLEDYHGLEPRVVSHAARLVAMLEAYALYDPEIGYCQGMSDLLSPILAVVEDDHLAFWCFVGLMGKARQNFRLDESGIRRQLGVVSKIIKHKDPQLYKHLEKLHAENCFFAYRMVVVMFRRELSFEQTVRLWEVVWAEQAAVRIGKLGSGRKVRRLHGVRLMPPPPTDDLLLFAVAASVLQRRRLIMDKCCGEDDDILRECNSMVGRLNVWRLLDDARSLVVDLHDKVFSSLDSPILQADVAARPGCLSDMPPKLGKLAGD